jgi:hypothetical protein
MNKERLRYLVIRWCIYRTTTIIEMDDASKSSIKKIDVRAAGIIGISNRVSDSVGSNSLGTSIRSKFNIGYIDRLEVTSKVLEEL